MAGTPPIGPPDTIRDLLAHAKTHGNARQITLPTSEADITSLVNDLAAKVPQTRTVNGHALSGNVTVSKSDVGLANADNTSDVNKPVSTAAAASIATKPTVVAAPAAADSVGVAGSIAFAADGSFVYYCVATGVWVRAAMATWGA